MDKLKLNAVIADNVEVLHQYSTNDNTDKKTLAIMIETLLCKFQKKEYFYLAMEKFCCEIHNLGHNNFKADWDIYFPTILNANTFVDHNNLSNEIVENVKTFYKIK
jgi:hypothetical protein